MTIHLPLFPTKDYGKAIMSPALYTVIVVTIVVATIAFLVACCLRDQCC
jgi:hypothetical protein